MGESWADSDGTTADVDFGSHDVHEQRNDGRVPEVRRYHTTRAPNHSRLQTIRQNQSQSRRQSRGVHGFSISTTLFL